MKKRLIKILTVICIMFITLNVSAMGPDSTFNCSIVDKTSKDHLYYGNNKSFNTNVFRTNENGTGKSYAGYCLDPHISFVSSLKVSRMLLESDNLKVQDFGLLQILKNGVSAYPIPSLEDYDATSFAVRMYINGFLGWAKTYAVNDATRAYVGQLYEIIMSDTELINSYKEIVGKDPSYILTQYGMSTTNYINFGYYDSVGQSTLAKAKTIVSEGIKAAAAYSRGEIKIPEIIATTAANIKYEGEENTKLIVVSFDMKDNPSAVNNYGVSSSHYVTSVEPLGMSYTYSTNPADYTTATTIDTSKGNVYFAYKVKYVTSDTEEDSTASIDIKYDAVDSRLLTGAVLSPTSGNAQKTQRFAVYDGGKIENTLHVVVNSGSACEPEVNLPPVCKDDTADIDKKTNTAKYSFKEGMLEGELKLTKCVINKSDAANNSYQLNDNEYASMVINNPYCSVSCKEDYEFTVPYKQVVENGRYFKIRMQIKGQQDCYSSKIDNAKFKEDVIQAQKDIIDNYNNWLLYYELANAKSDGRWTYVTEDSCSKRTCSSYTPPATKENPKPSSKCVSGSTTTSSVDVYKVTLKGNYLSYYVSGDRLVTHNGPKPTIADTYGHVSNSVGSCSDACSVQGYSCTTYSADTDYNTSLVSYTENLNAAKEKLDISIDHLKQIIDIYNGCMADKSYNTYSDLYSNAYWDMIYDFNPEIKYSYNEPEPNEIDKPKWIDEVKQKSCGNKTCDVMETLKSEINAEVCRDSSSTKCNRVSSVDLIFGGTKTVTEYCSFNDLNVDTYECSNPLSSPTYETRTYFNCKENGGVYSCGNETYRVTNVSYIHKVATASGDYDTPRVYYSHHTDGAIKIFGPTDNVEKNYDLVKGLPVGINTPQDTYFYILSIDNIGKYYSTGNLGRIYGHNSTSLSSIKNSVGSTTLNNDRLNGNDYACTYVVAQNTCEDEYGITHNLDTECSAYESISDCRKAICKNDKGYCVKEAQSFYVCENQQYEAGKCTTMSSRSEALAAVGCTEGEKCEKNYNCCPNCTVKCIGKCSYRFNYDENGNGNGELLLTFRSITPAGVNINNRQMGYNWDTANASNVLVARKALNTISEIEARANVSDAENLSEDEIKDIKGYDFKIKLTPNVATWVRKYNKDHSTDGSYNNDTMTCYDYTITGTSYSGNKDACEENGYTWKDNKCIMSNVFCYSSFIDELIDNNNGAVASDIVEKRNNAINSAHSNYLVYKNLMNLPDKSSSIVANDYWTIYIYDNLDVNGDGIPDIGPSWK